jgi:hypothetical protein
MPTEVAATSCFSGEAFSVPALTRAFKRQRQGHASPGNRRRPRAAIGLDHIAIQNHRPLAQRLHIHYRAQAASDQALNLMRPSADLAPLALRGLRVTVERGSMAYSAVTHPRPELRSQLGTPFSIVALHSTRVCSTEIKTEPSAVRTKSGVRVSGRS